MNWKVGSLESPLGDSRQQQENCFLEVPGTESPRTSLQFVTLSKGVPLCLCPFGPRFHEARPPHTFPPLEGNMHRSGRRPSLLPNPARSLLPKLKRTISLILNPLPKSEKQHCTNKRLANPTKMPAHPALHQTKVDPKKGDYIG